MPLIKRVILLGVLIGLAIIGLEGYIQVQHQAAENGEDLLVVGLVAYLIILSGPVAHYSGLPVAVIELLMGVLASYYKVSESEALTLLAGIGANMVLFMAGAEIDVALLRRRLRRALGLGLIGMLGPSAVGVALAYENGVNAIILSIAALSATSAALTYGILHSNGLSKSRTGQMVLAAAMLTDIAGMIFLNIATSQANPLLLLYGVIIVVALLVQPILARVERVGFETEIRLVTMALIVLGAATEFLGIHSVLTSFILGIIVSETLRERRLLREKLEGMAFGFFSPFFFIASGLMIDPSLLASEWIPVIVVGLVLFLLKFLPSYLYLRRRGTPPRSAVLYASSISPLLTVTLISAQVGVASGLIDERLYIIMVGSVLITSIMASILSLLVRGRLQRLEAHFF